MSRETGSQCVAVRLLACPKQAAVGSFGAGGSSKTFPDVPYQFRVSGCSGQAFHEDSEQSQDAWERGSNPELLAVSGS